MATQPIGRKNAKHSIKTRNVAPVLVNRTNHAQRHNNSTLQHSRKCTSNFYLHFPHSASTLEIVMEINNAMVLAAESMIANGMDYWPYGLIDYPVTADMDYCLYAYKDGVWLVDTNNTCSMNEAIKIVKVVSI